MAQLIDKQITDVSSTINVLKGTVSNLGASSHEVLMQPKDKVVETSIEQNVNKPISRHVTDSPSVNK